MSIFSEKLQKATSEDKQVNKYYVDEIAKELPKVNTDNIGGGTYNINTLSDIFPNIKTDGVYECTCRGNGFEKWFLLQLECKLDVDFSNPEERAKVILQVCSYLKQIHDAEAGYGGTWQFSRLPKVVVLGSKINCIALPVNILLPYAMDYIADYKKASVAYKNPANEHKLKAIVDDANITQYSIARDVTDKNCIRALSEQIIKLGNNLKITDDLSEHTVSLAFDFFDMNVIDKKSSSKLTSREKVDLFIGTFFNEEFEETKTNRFASNPDKLKIHGTEVKINPDKYNQFKLLYNMREYSRLEQKQITAITDRLIEDTDRRRKGDFYTPSIWVDEAHKLLDKNLGENWRDEYMVWDCAWGTGNLTRDYKFTDLYCSTLQEEDLNIGYRYNKGAVKFQYDFLNDDVEEMENIETIMYQAGRIKNTNPVMAQALVDQANSILFNTKLYKKAPGLIDGLLGLNGKPRKKLLFLINPPYAAANNMKKKANTEGLNKETSETKIKELMQESKAGKASQNLYNQFIYRIYRLKKLFSTDLKLGIFCPTQVHTGRGNVGLREELNTFWIKDMFMLQAGQFADVAGNWSISFSIFDKVSKVDNSIKCSVYEYTNGKTELNCIKQVYNLDNISDAANWIKQPNKKKKTDLGLQLSSALNVGKGNAPLGRVTSDHIGYCVMDGNNIDANTSQVYLLSTSAYHGHGVSVTPDNFNEFVSLFAARKIITGQYATWINSKDEYMIPNTSHPLYKQWQSDCIVYSLFNTASNQSSLRNISYNGKQWNIQNEFFWMSVKDIEDIAGGKYSTDDINTAIENDIEDFGKERFVYKKLQEVTLSPDAQVVLDKATELVKSSFKYRKQFNQEEPDYHINTWDAGWYQIKGLLKAYDPNGLKEFNALYKALEDRMRDLVYELGFLYR